MTPQRIVLIRGDTRTLSVALFAGSDLDLEAVDHLRFTAKCRASATTAVLSKSLGSGITVTDDDAATIDITEADWDDWDDETDLVWDIEARVTSPARVVTLAVGTLTVVPDVTRDAP